MKIDRSKIFIAIAIILFALCLIFVIYFLKFAEENIEASIGSGMGNADTSIKFNFDKLKEVGL